MSKQQCTCTHGITSTAHIYPCPLATERVVPEKKEHWAYMGNRNHGRVEMQVHEMVKRILDFDLTQITIEVVSKETFELRDSVQQIRRRCDDAEESVRFYRREWENSCERLNYAKEEFDEMKKEFERVTLENKDMRECIETIKMALLKPLKEQT